MKSLVRWTDRESENRTNSCVFTVYFQQLFTELTFIQIWMFFVEYFQMKNKQFDFIIIILKICLIIRWSGKNCHIFVNVCSEYGKNGLAGKHSYHIE